MNPSSLQTPIRTSNVRPSAKFSEAAQKSFPSNMERAIADYFNSTLIIPRFKLANIQAIQGITALLKNAYTFCHISLEEIVLSCSESPFVSYKHRT